MDGADLWHRARRDLESKDLAMARSLGFDSCQRCGQWFQQASEEWRDCVGCGRHCQTCAEDVGWLWCADCGHHTCQRCADDSLSIFCTVCQIQSAGATRRPAG